MTLEDDCNHEIEKRLAKQPANEVVQDAISKLIEAKITQALYNCNIGGLPSHDPAQDVDFNERILSAAMTMLVYGRTDNDYLTNKIKR